MSRAWLVRLAGTVVVSAMMAAAPTAIAQVSPEYTDWMRIGRSAYQSNDFAAAETAFKLVLAAAQTPRQRATANGLLALTAEQMKRTDDARRYAQEGLRHFPEEERSKAVLNRLR